MLNLHTTPNGGILPLASVSGYTESEVAGRYIYKFRLEPTLCTSTQPKLSLGNYIMWKISVISALTFSVRIAHVDSRFTWQPSVTKHKQASLNSPSYHLFFYLNMVSDRFSLWHSCTHHLSRLL
jgi:hypothetical protein